MMMFRMTSGRALVIASSIGFLSNWVSPVFGFDPLAVDSKEGRSQQDLTCHDNSRNRDIPLRIYLPSTHGAAPVILFSHGLGGSKAGSRFLGEHWAARGYVAVFVQHPGSDDSVWRNEAMADRMEALKNAVSVDNFLLRVGDVHAVLNQLELWNASGTNGLAGRLDLKRVGMSGHSFGAITTEAVSGESLPVGGKKFVDSRIKAALVLSPSAPVGGSAEHAFGDVRIPWLLMTGTKDLAPIGHADLKSRLAVYPALHGASKYELVLKNAEHSVFTDRALPGDHEPRNPNHHRVILGLSAAFWDAFLKEDHEALAWLSGSGPRSIMEPEDHWQCAAAAVSTGPAPHQN